MEMISTIPPSEDQVDAKPEPHLVSSNRKRVRSPTFQPGPLNPKQKKRILTAGSTSASDSDRFSEVLSSDEEPEGKENKRGFRYAVPESSPEPTLVQGTHPSGSLNEDRKSENPVPEPDPASSFGQESLSLPQLKKALKWFRLVQRMVTRECMNDYVLKDFCPPQALLFFVYHGWVELQDVMPTSSPQAATHEAGSISVQISLYTPGAQESGPCSGRPIPMCQYPKFFTSNIATGQQTPSQIHRPCDSYVNTAAHSIGYQANLGCSYNPQATSMGFVPVNEAGPAIISSGQQDDFETTFGFNGALQTAQPSMPSTWPTSGTLNATFFETGGSHAPSQVQSQLPWAAQAQAVPQVSFHQIPQTLDAQEESLRPPVPLLHRANSCVPQLTPLFPESPPHSPVHPLDLLAHDDQDSNETTEEKPQDSLPLRRDNRWQGRNQTGTGRRRGTKSHKGSNNAPLPAGSSEFNGLNVVTRQALVALVEAFLQPQSLIESQPEDSMTLDSIVYLAD
ncbi:hypothetical protein ACEPAI_1823 [Sanghuangporus weigelae]